jgi:hypothetical protein
VSAHRGDRLGTIQLASSNALHQRLQSGVRDLVTCEIQRSDREREMPGSIGRQRRRRGAGGAKFSLQSHAISLVVCSSRLIGLCGACAWLTLRDDPFAPHLVQSFVVGHLSRENFPSPAKSFGIREVASKLLPLLDHGHCLLDVDLL